METLSELKTEIGVELDRIEAQLRKMRQKSEHATIDYAEVEGQKRGLEWVWYKIYRRERGE